MIELIFKGTKRYYAWMTALLAVMGVGTICYLWQLSFGLGITGMTGVYHRGEESWPVFNLFDLVESNVFLQAAAE